MSLPIIQSASLAALPNISHLFTTRNGGVSQNEYASLNCGRFSGDDPFRVAENHGRVIEAMGSGRLISLKQVHGKTALTVDHTWTGRENTEGDGMVTAVPGMALAVMAADCAPVLLADARNRVIGAAHAGWKGALSGITDKVIEKMCALGAERESITVAIGPAIQQSSYEVGQEFMRHFVVSGGSRCRQFFQFYEGSIYFDLPGYVAGCLAEQGIAHIDCLPQDTYSMEQEFFSYRRSSKQGETDYGRQAGAISLVDG